MLSYKSVEEARDFLGRNLTVSETLWFRYTAQKSDYLLYCHNTLFLIVFYTLFPSVIEILIRSLKSIDKHKLQPKFRSSFSDMIHCYKNTVLTFSYTVGPLQLLSYPTVKWVGTRTSLVLPSGAEIFSQILVYFVIEDYLGYWIHRLLHSKWCYDNIHVIHHEYSAPLSFAAPYAHWAEVIIQGLPTLVGPLLVPCHMITFWLWFLLRQLQAIETHSGYDFPWSPSKFIPLYGGAIHHDYHHYVGGKSHSNFASVFTYCDYIYGTDKGYQYQMAVTKKMERQGVKKSD